MDGRLAARLRELEETCRRKGISAAVDADSKDFWLYVCAAFSLMGMAARGERDLLADMLRNGPFRPAKKLLDRRASPWRMCQRMLDDFPDERVREFFRGFVVAATPGLAAALDARAAGCREFCARLREKFPYSDFQLYALARAFLGGADGLPEPDAEETEIVEEMRARYRIANLEYRLRKSGVSPDQEKAARLLAPYRAEIARLQEKLARAGERVEEASALAELSEGEKQRLATENERLRRELAAAHEEHARKVAALEAELARLRRRIAALIASGRGSPLAGARVCVAGDPSRAAVYRDILARRGAEMEFLDGFGGKGRAAEAAAAADGAVVVAAYCCHAVYEAVKGEAAKRGIPLVLVKAAGAASFEGGVEELEKRLAGAACRAEGVGENAEG